MKKKLNINGIELEIELESLANGKVVFEYNGERFEFENLTQDNDSFILKNSFNKLFELMNLKEGVFLYQGKEFRVENAKESRQKATQASTGKLVAPLPVKLSMSSHKNGDTVKVGDEIVVVEAMKMEHRICADAEGTLKNFDLKVGDTVQEGQELGEIS